MDAFQHIQSWLGIGIDPKEFTLSQLLLRSLIVFTTMYLMIRIAGRRFMAQKNAWDVVLAFLVASMLARAINGSASFWANIALGFIVAVAYRIVAWAACQYPSFGRFPTESGKAQFFARPCLPPAELPDTEFPFVLTTGRVAHQWHTLTKTGKIATLNKLNPGPFVEINPEDADSLNIKEGTLVKVSSRRGLAIYPAQITPRITALRTFVLRTLPHILPTRCERSRFQSPPPIIGIEVEQTWNDDDETTDEP